jgi:hypothetical protein
LEYGVLQDYDFETEFDTDEENMMNLASRNALIEHFW